MKMKDYNYFQSFIKFTQYAYESAEELLHMMKEFDTDTLSLHLENMRSLKQSSHALRHEMVERLSNEFLPPIDREDIIVMSNALDDVVDRVEDISIGLYVYNVQEIREEAIAYSDVILQSCEALKQMMSEFSNFQKSKTLVQYIKNINALEEKGDMLYSKTTRLIFTSDLDAVEVMKWTSIYDRMENACDACEKIGSLVENVILKYA